MSILSSPLPPAPSPEPVFRLSVDQYHAMIDAGVLTDDDPVELLEGITVFKMPKKPARGLAVRKLTRAVEKLLPPGWFVLSQEPITLSTGEPEPDAAVVRGTDEDYAARHPGPPDVALVVEVADTTVERDRTIKLRSYAGAGIPLYLIINLVERAVEIYSDPQPASALYRATKVVREGESFDVLLNAKSVGNLNVGDLLPDPQEDRRRR